jgi:hypothetical protein
MRDPEFRERFAGAFVDTLRDFYDGAEGTPATGARTSMAAGAP